MVLSHTYTNRASIFINADAVTNMQDKANMDFRRMTTRQVRCERLKLEVATVTVKQIKMK